MRWVVVVEGQSDAHAIAVWVSGRSLGLNAANMVTEQQSV